MTITCDWLGDAGQTTARIVVRSTANGDVTAVVNGTTFTSASPIDTAVNDGIGFVDVTGLAPGNTYSAAVSVAGASTVIRKIKTMPSNSPFKVAFMGCLDKLISIESLSRSLVAEDIAAMFWNGDFIYTSTGLTSYWGETSAPVSTTSVLADYMTHWRQTHRNSGVLLLDRFCPSYWQGDDHEVGGDNWDHTVTQAQVTPNVASGGTQAQVDAAWWLGNQAMVAYFSGNPTNNDTGIAASTDKPSNAAGGTAASQYPPKYFRKTIGHVEFFVLDCISYRSPLTATDNASKTMLGATQKQWLKDRLAASTATFKVICSGKNLYPQNTTADGWEVYTTERAELLAYVTASVPTKGVFWVVGDNHAPQVCASTSLDFSCFCPNSAGQPNITQSAGYATNVVWKYLGSGSGVPARVIPVAGLLLFENEYAEMRFIDPLGRTLVDADGNLGQWRIYAGSNLLVQSG